MTTRRDAVRSAVRASSSLVIARERRDVTIAAAVLDHGVPLREIARLTGVDLKQIHRIVARERERRELLPPR